MKTVAKCPMISPSAESPPIPLPCTRLQALLHQQAWLAVDEMNFHFDKLQKQGFGDFVSAGTNMDCPEDPKFQTWCRNMTEIEQVGKAKFSAFLQDGHWHPIALLFMEDEVQIVVTPEGKQWAQKIAYTFGEKSKQTTITTRVLIGEFPGDCGFQSIPWIMSTIDGNNRKPMNPQEAEVSQKGICRISLCKSQSTRSYFLSCKSVAWIKNVPSALTQMLVEHGVFRDRVEERVNMLLDKLPSSTIMGILQSPKPWVDLKAAANMAKPALKLVMADELAHQITQRAKDNQAVGKKSMKNKGALKERAPLILQTSDLNIPAGVFKQQDGTIVFSHRPSTSRHTCTGSVVDEPR